MPPTISIYPDPPIHGETLSVSTNGTLPKHLSLTYTVTPSGTKVVKLTMTEGKENVLIPADAVGVTIHDLDGQCNDVSRIII